MTVTTWIGTPKALYRMALHGGEEWDRLKSSLPQEQRETLSRLNQRIDTLAAELLEAKESHEHGVEMRRERQRLQKPWEEARQVALDPPGEFVIAKELAALLQSEPARKFRTRELAKRLNLDRNSPKFTEAVRLIVASGFAEWTGSKIRAVGVGRLVSDGLEYRRIDHSLAMMCARVRALGVAPLWMLHKDGSPDSTPTESQSVLNQLILRLDGFTWAGPGIVASASADLESLDVDQVWPANTDGERGTAEIEKELTQAKAELKAALKAATEELWARRDPTLKPSDGAVDTSSVEEPEAAHVCPVCAEESRPGAAFCSQCGTCFAAARNCDECGAERVIRGNYCPDCGTEYGAQRAVRLNVTDLSGARRAEPRFRPGAKRLKPSLEAANGGRVTRRRFDESGLDVKHFEINP